MLIFNTRDEYLYFYQIYFQESKPCDTLPFQYALLGMGHLGAGPTMGFWTDPIYDLKLCAKRTAFSFSPTQILGLQYSDVHLHFRSTWSISAIGWKI